MTSLYQLTGEMLRLRNELSELQLDPQTIADTIEGEAGERDEKIVKTMMVYDELADDIDIIKAHVKRLQDRVKRIESNRETLKQRVMDSMRVTNTHRIAHPLMTVTFQKDRDEAVEILDIDQIPVSCMKLIPASSEPNKVAIKAYIKGLCDEDAQIFTGARLVKSDRLQVTV